MNTIPGMFCMIENNKHWWIKWQFSVRVKSHNGEKSKHVLTKLKNKIKIKQEMFQIAFILFLD